MTDMSAVEKYFVEYRQAKKQASELLDEIKKSKKQYESLIRQHDMLSGEISAMQSIITRMVDNGWDPVEAKLRETSDDTMYPSNLWDNMSYNTGTIPTIGITSTGKTSITATGTLVVSGGYSIGSIK